mmetsp:Transcript_2505/g.2956  ORF Transcript_2505/g.2956 Transcript_2505/m.2956 type:complete len:190 (-) Transcript_2505:193-762(-)
MRRPDLLQLGAQFKLLTILYLNNSIPSKSPSFAFPKDKSQTYIEIATRKGKKMPGPGDYEIKSCFDTPKKSSIITTSFGSRSEKKNFLDDAIRVGKLTPGPGHFNPKTKSRIIGGMNVKGYRSSFLDECECVGKEKPGVGKYKPNYKPVEKQYSIPAYKRPPPIESWKFKKTNKPAPGSYEAAESYKKV